MLFPRFEGWLLPPLSGSLLVLVVLGRQAHSKPIVWASPSTGHAGARNGQRRVENNDFSYFIQEPTHHEVHLNCFGVMLRIDSRNAPPSGQRGRLPGTGMAEMRRNLYVGPSWGYVGPSGVMLGAMFANLGVIWGYVATSWPPAGPCCGRCWTVGHPPR